MKVLKKVFKRNASLVHIREANRQFAQDISSSMYVLDAGAGSAPYRELFGHAHYETADAQNVVKAYTDLTYVCDLSQIPVEPGRYDRIVFNQVMEHLCEPGQVLAEFYRVLKPGGKVLCTCPLFYEEHEKPYDFYRYTQFGLRYEFEKAGFAVEKLEWLEGFFATAAYQLHRIRRDLPLFDRQVLTDPVGLLCVPFLALVKVFAFFSAPILSALDLRIKAVSAGYPINYLLIARKA